MCGISGSLSLGGAGYSIPAARIQYNLMLASTMRGVDGAGVVVGGLDHSQSAIYRRGIDAAHEVVSRNKMEAMTRQGRWVIAHTRSATLGTITEESTHPFAAGMVVGVHNGTIYGTASLFPEHIGINDSETVYKAIAAEEPDSATEVLKVLDPGAYVLVWYDARINALRFARNADRPLWFYKDEDMWWWHSEPSAIAMCLARTYVDKPLAYTDILPKQLRANCLLTVPVDGSAATLETYEPVYEAPAIGKWNDAAWGYDEAYDAWGGYGVVTPGIRSKATSSEGWLSVFSALDIWNSSSDLIGFRSTILGAISKLFRTIASSDSTHFNTCLQDVANRAGGGDDAGTVDFVGQVYNETSGMVYGAVDVLDFAPMPVVCMLDKTAREDYNLEIEEELNITPDSTRLPLFRGTLTNLKVYAEGAIGMGLDAVEFAGWVDSSSVTLTEDAVGSLKTHPHLMESTWEDQVDWSIWDPINVVRKAHAIRSMT